jgi:hypothetical protein
MGNRPSRVQASVIKLLDDLDQRSTPTWRYPSWWGLFVTLPLALGAAFSIHSWVSDRAIAKREKTTEGTIIAHRPANHDQYGYRFSANGKSYSVWETPRR